MWSSSSFPPSSSFSLGKPSSHPSLSLILPTKTQNAHREVADGDSSEVALSIPPFHVKYITSTSNPFVKHCVKLRNSSSYRHSHNSVLLVGTTPLSGIGICNSNFDSHNMICNQGHAYNTREIYNFQESIQEKPTTIDCILLHEKATVPEELIESGVHVVRVNSMVMKKLSGLQSTESIDLVSLVRIPSTFCPLNDDHHEDFSNWFPSAYRILVLDGIQDPGNLGTLLRSAVAFGWDGAFLLPGCCDPFNEKALRASRGASFQLPMVSGTWSHLQSLINGFQMKILAGHPGSNHESKPVSFLSYETARNLTDTKVCLVLGSEGSGLSKEAREACELVTIRMGGGFESLNVSVAGGIFLFMLQPQNKS